MESQIKLLALGYSRPKPRGISCLKANAAGYESPAIVPRASQQRKPRNLPPLVGTTRPSSSSSSSWQRQPQQDQRHQRRQPCVLKNGLARHQAITSNCDDVPVFLLEFLRVRFSRMMSLASNKAFFAAASARTTAVTVSHTQPQRKQHTLKHQSTLHGL
jgi:hypothetical protein